MSRRSPARSHDADGELPWPTISGRHDAPSGQRLGLYRPDHQRARNEQIRQICDERISPNLIADGPLFICGDFCTPQLGPYDRARASDGYRLTLATFEGDNGPEYRITLDDCAARNDLAVDETGRTDELGYILVRCSGASLSTKSTRLILRHPVGIIATRCETCPIGTPSAPGVAFQ